MEEMKMKKIGCALLVCCLAALSALACAKTLSPLELTGDLFSLTEGNYFARLSDLDRIYSGGTFTARLYVQDIYDADAVRSLAPGDTLKVAGKSFTVKSVSPVDNGVEVIPREDFGGYIVMVQVAADQAVAMVNDCIISSPVGEIRVMMPLHNDFVFTEDGDGEEVVSLNQDQFAAMVDRDKRYTGFTEYNTTLRLKDGMVVAIRHQPYPEELDMD